MCRSAAAGGPRGLSFCSTARCLPGEREWIHAGLCAPPGLEAPALQVDGVAPVLDPKAQLRVEA